MKHTLGNWTAKEVRQNDRDKIFWESEVISGGIRVAKVAGVGKETAEANARLISQSPVMKSILDNIQHDLARYQSEGDSQEAAGYFIRRMIAHVTDFEQLKF